MFSLDIIQLLLFLQRAATYLFPIAAFICIPISKKNRLKLQRESQPPAKMT